jgi:Rrf2 family nitric oxide-sensitive transcriptional repressor
VIQTLSEHGYVTVTPGRSGGVVLAQKPHRIRLGDVARIAEANLRVVECFDAETNTCPIVPLCQLKPILEEALAAFLRVLDNYTLADLLDGRRRSNLAKVLAASYREKQAPS